MAKDEAAVAAEFDDAGLEAVLVAFDIESITGTPPCSNAYVAALRDRYPERSSSRRGVRSTRSRASRRSARPRRP